MAEEYELGYNQGSSEANIARAKKALEVGYNPNPLR